MDKMPYGIVKKMLADGWTEKTFVYPSEFTALEHPLGGLFWRDLGSALPHLKRRLFLQPNTGGWTAGIDLQSTSVVLKDNTFAIEGVFMAIAYWPNIEKVLGYYEVNVKIKDLRVAHFMVAERALEQKIKDTEIEIETLQGKVLELWNKKMALYCPSCKGKGMYKIGKVEPVTCAVCNGTGWNTEVKNG